MVSRMGHKRPRVDVTVHMKLPPELFDAIVAYQGRLEEEQRTRITAVEVMRALIRRGLESVGQERTGT